MCFCFDGSTTSQYQIYGASSFGEHAFLLSFIDTAESIISKFPCPLTSWQQEASSQLHSYGIVLLPF